MSARSHAFLTALAASLLYVHMTHGIELGFIPTWSLIVLLSHHILDIMADSSGLKRIKMIAVGAIFLALAFRFSFWQTAEATWEFWRPWAFAAVCTLPIIILAFVPIHYYWQSPPAFADEDKL